MVGGHQHMRNCIKGSLPALGKLRTSALKSSKSGYKGQSSVVELANEHSTAATLRSSSMDGVILSFQFSSGVFGFNCSALVLPACLEAFIVQFCFSGGGHSRLSWGPMFKCHIYVACGWAFGRYSSSVLYLQKVGPPSPTREECRLHTACNE